MKIILFIYIYLFTLTSFGNTKSLKYGEMIVSTKWIILPDLGEDALRGFIEFVPTKVSYCKRISMVQIAKVLDSYDRDYKWLMGEAPRNIIKTKENISKEIKGGYYVDHQAVKCKKNIYCSEYFRDSWPNSDESSDGFKINQDLKSASLVDYPFGWSVIGRINLETCAKCDDNQKYLGCASWGAHWPLVGDRKLFPIKFSNEPSKTFNRAIYNFYMYYNNKP